ncbi:MAG: ABC transporter ATP-binding protein [Rhodovibrionaceae bacterium]
MSEAILEITKLSKNFGGVSAVSAVDLTLRKGELVGLIGPNGAGKTTLVNLVTGVFPPSSGRIVFNGEDVTGQKPYQAARRGMARTFQIVQPFPDMNVLDNVAAGALFSGSERSLAAARDAAYEHLKFVGIDPLASQQASSLTLANRKRMELAKSLAMKPTVLMLDEVNAGLNSGEIEGAMDLIREVARQGTTILIIEHLMKVMLGVSERIVVLHHGELIASGTPSEIVNDDRVIEAYLGQKFAAQARELADG